MTNLLGHTTFLSIGIVTVLWYRYVYGTEKRSFFDLLFFPFTNFSKILQIGLYPSIITIVFCYILFLHGAITLLSNRDPVVYLIGACISTLCIVFYPIHWLFTSNKIFNILYLTLSIAIVGFFGYLTYLQKDFTIWSNFDFVIQIYLLCISLYVISRIVIKDLFEEKIVDLFVYIGFVTYSFLQIAATIILNFGFSEHYDFAVTATLFTMFFWILSVPWILRLKSKLS